MKSLFVGPTVMNAVTTGVQCQTALLRGGGDSPGGAHRGHTKLR